MLFFRKFRERRANRRKQRQQGDGVVYKAINNIPCTNDFGKKVAIFRSERVNIGMSPYNNNIVTTDPTEDDDDDASMTSSVYMRLLNPPSTKEVLDKGAVFDDAALARADKELQDLKAELEEVQAQHEVSISEKNEELLVCKVSLGFSKENTDRLAEDLSSAKAKVKQQDSELEHIKTQLETTENKMNETITELDDVKDELAAKSALLSQAEKTIEEKDQEIFDLGKALDQGKRGAKVVLGLLTLGALCTDGER